jgi:hypothetical protein
VIPPNAVMKPALRAQLTMQGIPITPPTSPPHKFTFDYLDLPLAPDLLEDGATVDNGIYEFSLRDAVLAVFVQPFYTNNEFCWAFSTTTQTDVVAAVRVGETLDIEFDCELASAKFVNRYHFPPGIAYSDNGNHAFHIQIDGLSGSGFRLVSAFEPHANKTTSRLPFFMGFRVFGTAKDDPELPVWREALGQAVLEALFERWEYALLFSAFALESFIDSQMTARLMSAGLGEEYTKHVLQIADKRYELHALNEPTGSLSRGEINSQSENLNKKVFTPRNRLAHGKTRGRDITEEIAADAVRTVVQFVWDNDKTQRHLLLSETPTHDISSLIDDDLLSACARENAA